MNHLLRTLDNLSYVIECVALDYLGEAKTELYELCFLLENDQEFFFDGNAEVAAKLRMALNFLSIGEKVEGAGCLSRVSRSLWRQVVGQVPKQETHMDCTQQAQKIYEICVSAAKDGKTLSYRDVLDYLGYGNRVQGHSIRYGLELAWIACAHTKLPILTSIVIAQATGEPNSEGFSVANWEADAQRVFGHNEWPHVDEIDWAYVWDNRVELSKVHQTRGHWTK